MRGTRWLGWPLLLCSIVAARAAGQTTLSALSQSVEADQRARVVRFEIVCNRAPDFFTLGANQAPADSFQFLLDTEPGNRGVGGLSPNPWEFVVRGDEIHIGKNIPIRDHVRGPSEVPWSGGWGPVAGSVPYTLAGSTLRFEIPFSMLNTSTGKFPYRLELYHYGTMTGRLESGGQADRIPGAGAPSGEDPSQASEDDVSMGPHVLIQSALMAIGWPVGLFLVWVAAGSGARRPSWARRSHRLPEFTAPRPRGARIA